MSNPLKSVYKKVYFKYLLSIIWTVVIVFLSLGRMPDTDDKINIPHLDKVVHLSMYFIYAFLIMFETRHNNKKSTILLIALYTILFGALMELFQLHLFAYRSGDIFDAVSNTVGVLFAIIFFPKLQKFIKT